MAKYIVPPKSDPIIKCKVCKALYVSEIYTERDFSYYEKCPYCGCKCNTEEQRIPLWRYNLIKYFRGGFH